MSTSLYVPSPYQSNTLRKTRSIDTSCMDLREVSTEPFPRPLVRAKSDFNIASSNASLNSNDYGIVIFSNACNLRKADKNILKYLIKYRNLFLNYLSSLI